MRISDLARQSGLPVATIKFYLREGLLQPGAPISRTQAEYSDSHLERLRLIRALRDIADLPVATVGTVLAAVDDTELPLLDLLGVTQTAVAGSKGSAAATEDGLELADRLLADLDWTLTEDSPLVNSLARVLDVLQGEGEPVDAESLRPWAEAARAVAEVEMDHIPIEAPRADAAHTVAVGTVIYGELLVQLRLVAQEAVSLARFGPEALRDKAQPEKGQLEKGQLEKGQRKNGVPENGQRANGQRANGQRENGQRENGQRENGQRENGQREKGQRKKEHPTPARAAGRGR